MPEAPLLSVRNLRTWFDTDRGVVKAVDGVTFDIRAGETLGVVGESGCGKSMTALSIMRLFRSPPGRIVEGSIGFEGRELTTLSKRDMRSVRGGRIAMIFQDPMTSLNPVHRVGDQIVEAILLHQDFSRVEARERGLRMLTEVGIAAPDRRFREYPHQLSGGMRQRVMIAMALSCNPRLLIADEPTTALDATVQNQIIALMNDLKARYGTAIMFITHDLGVVAETAQRVIVMYAGKVVESSGVEPLFERPLHPYTVGLLASRPSDQAILERSKLDDIQGSVPNLLDLPQGCSFHPRCPRCMPRCSVEAPPLFAPELGRAVACWLHEDGRGREGDPA